MEIDINPKSDRHNWGVIAQSIHGLQDIYCMRNAMAGERR